MPHRAFTRIHIAYRLRSHPFTCANSPSLSVLRTKPAGGGRVNDTENERIIVGPLEIRPDRYLVLLGERTLPLSERELTLLTVLARRVGEVVTRERLYELA